MIQERKRTYKRKTVDNITAVSTEMGNIPPQATDIEEAVLGAMMVNTDSVDQVMDILKPEAFYDIKNRCIFQAMFQLFNERSPIDMLTVVEKMKQDGTVVRSDVLVRICMALECKLSDIVEIIPRVVKEV